MDKASAYEAEDSRFDPWVGRLEGVLQLLTPVLWRGKFCVL